jgi:glycogen debranching enzyme
VTTTPTPWTATTTGARVGGSSRITLVEGSTFLVASGSGELSGQGVDGLFVIDTRVLSRWQLTIDNQPVEALSSVERGPFALTMAAQPRTATTSDSPILVLRTLHVGRGLHDDITIRSYAATEVEVTVRLSFDADFASLFDVKGGVVQTRTDNRWLADGTGSIRLTIDDGSGPTLATVVRFDPAPDRVSDAQAEWTIRVEPHGERHLCAEVGVEVGGVRLEPAVRCGDTWLETAQATRYSEWTNSTARFSADDERITEAATQAVDDLGTLRIFDPRHADRVVVAAGAPWFMTLFGRDSILTGWMALLVDTELAAGVLKSLADLQGKAEVASTEEQPGRILHEVRYDHRSLGLLGGSNVYYGTIDATPLFVMLAAEHLRWTGDFELAARLLPAVDQALEWLRVYGDRDGDGFVEYLRTQDGGLANQGWKDSWDGIRYADGRVAEAPIALCEVQAYVYGAYRARAYLADALGDAAVAARFQRAATDLAVAFDTAFWLEDLGTYCVGLDGEKQPIDSSSSNPGHCLWAGIALPHRAPQLAATLAASQLNSGWGLRTLAADNPGYNPLSYHCGSVWPHDTALAVAGLRRYDCHEAADTLQDGLLAASASFGGRLPELFAGLSRQEMPTPVVYPASCSPQAWAAAAPLLMIRSLLGLEPDVPNHTVRVRSNLPSTGRLDALGVPLGQGRIDVRASGTTIRVDGLPAGTTLDQS